ncbi:Clp protease N-terminal domain-containing protein [Allobranchiibius sp. GilTou38]|uniref:Clp protease N-terminal domain-containing protein n=1 Tax=Allobranchiibius sp. GilTou38 TaxID=2815210 RepID=UPI001AA1A9B7|nr:Clp protease N-terminal domain-containing protein [Allobranchiibius sp. GilTou38]MBO1765306.1 Clp protease N-terminal domain-containing protein [Allobranchiibius sp. GilTou38]
MFHLRNSDVGIAMMQAHDVAAELGHSEVGPDHILLGLTTNLRSPVAPLLAEHGLTYPAARDILTAQHSGEASDPDNDSDDDGPQTANLDDDRDALASIGIDLDKVTEAVGEAFGEDITRAWGRRRERAERDDRRGRRDEDRPRRGPGPGMPPTGPGFGGFGRFPNSEWFADFPDFQEFNPFGGPRGRGRRGPQSRRFGRGPRPSEATVRIFRDLRAQAQEARATAQDDDRQSGRTQFHAMFRAEHIVLAILHSDDPATRAMVSAMTDVDRLRTQLHERLAADSAA